MLPQYDFWVNARDRSWGPIPRVMVFDVIAYLDNPNIGLKYIKIWPVGIYSKKVWQLSHRYDHDLKIYVNECTYSLTHFVTFIDVCIKRNGIQLLAYDSTLKAKNNLVYLNPKL